jgi:hypothetical protein
MLASPCRRSQLRVESVAGNVKQAAQVVQQNQRFRAEGTVHVTSYVYSEPHAQRKREVGVEQCWKAMRYPAS